MPTVGVNQEGKSVLTLEARMIPLGALILLAIVLVVAAIIVAGRPE
jgi:hypothetical protein